LTKRILAISNHGNMLGGGEHSFLDLLSHLPEPWNVLAIVPEKGGLATRLEKNGVKTRVIPLPSMKPWNLSDILSSLKSFFNLCRRNSPDLIYANGSRAAFYAGIVARILKIPILWHCRIADPDIYLDFILTKLINGIIANSRATANRFKQSCQSRVSVVHNGVDFGWLRDDNVQQPGVVGDGWKVILVVARASRWKRHDLALTAFERVAEAEPNAHLFCLGAPDALESEWWDYLQDRSSKSAFARRIHWVGHVDDVRPWYKAADVMVLASENEPFGRVLVEAMASGVPVVATRAGGIPEIIRHERDGLLVNAGKEDEFAQAVTTILNNHALRKRLIFSGLERSQLFGIKAHTEKMIEVFNRVLKESKD